MSSFPLDFWRPRKYLRKKSWNVREIILYNIEFILYPRQPDTYWVFTRFRVYKRWMAEPREFLGWFDACKNLVFAKIHTYGVSLRSGGANCTLENWLDLAVESYRGVLLFIELISSEKIASNEFCCGFESRAVVGFGWFMGLFFVVRFDSL